MPDDPRISIDELHKRIEAGETFAFLDSRNPQAWSDSDVKIPGAIRVPADDLRTHLSEIPKHTGVITYCT